MRKALSLALSDRSGVTATFSAEWGRGGGGLWGLIIPLGKFSVNPPVFSPFQPQNLVSYSSTPFWALQLAFFSSVQLLQVSSDSVETGANLINQKIVSSEKSLKKETHIVNILF